MRKLKLDVEALAVESFSADPEGAGGQGTVKGHSGSGVWTFNEPTVCEQATCKWTECYNLSCLAECSGGNGTLAGNTCNVTCNTNPGIE